MEDSVAFNNVITKFSSVIVKQTMVSAFHRRRLAFDIREVVFALFGDVQFLERSTHALNLLEPPGQATPDCNESSVLELPNASLDLVMVVELASDACFDEQAGYLLSLLEKDIASKSWLSGGFQHLYCNDNGPILNFQGKGGKVVNLSVVSNEQVPRLQLGLVREKLQLYPEKLQPLVLFTKQLLCHNGIITSGNSVVVLCSKFLCTSAETRKGDIGSEILDFLDFHSNEAEAISSCGFCSQETNGIMDIFFNAVSLHKEGVKLERILFSGEYRCNSKNDTYRGYHKEPLNVHFRPSDHVYIGNIDQQVTEYDLVNLYQQVLGEPPNRIIVRSPYRSPQHCFIWCYSQRQASACISALHGYLFFGRNLRANYAIRKDAENHTAKPRLQVPRQQACPKTHCNKSFPALKPTLAKSNQHAPLPPLPPPPYPPLCRDVFRDETFQFCRGIADPQEDDFFQPHPPHAMAPVSPYLSDDVQKGPVKSMQHAIHPTAFMPFTSPPNQNQAFFPPPAQSQAFWTGGDDNFVHNRFLADVEW